MQNQSVVVFTSSNNIQVSLDRIRVAPPALRELQLSIAPTDPRREILDLTIAASERAEEWLTQYVQPVGALR